VYLSYSLNPFFSYGEIIATAAGGIVKNGKHFLERKTQDIPNRPETATLLPESMIFKYSPACLEM
jgi:hypothetical protein